jgi:hypothetical protein
VGGAHAHAHRRANTPGSPHGHRRDRTGAKIVPSATATRASSPAYPVVHLHSTAPRPTSAAHRHPASAHVRRQVNDRGRRLRRETETVLQSPSLPPRGTVQGQQTLIRALVHGAVGQWPTSTPAPGAGTRQRSLSLEAGRGGGGWYAQQSYANSTDLTSRQPGGRPGQLGYRRPDAMQTTLHLRVVGGERRSAPAADRLSLSCSGGVGFLLRLKAGVSTEESR